MRFVRDFDANAFMAPTLSKQRGDVSTNRAAPTPGAGGASLLLLVPPVAAGIGLLAVVAAVLGFGLAGQGAFWFELGKTALNVIAVAVVGGIAAAAFRKREGDRDRERLKDSYRSEFINEVWDAYHKAKTVRRELAAAGVTQHLKSGAALTTLSAEQRALLVAQMRVLNDAQLTLEKLYRTVRREADEVFPGYGRRLRSLLRLAESYARDVLHAYEKPDGDPDALVCFLGKAHRPGGVNRLTVALERAADIVYALRSGAGRRTRPPTDPLEDCDLWSGGEIHRSDKHEKDDEPPCSGNELKGASHPSREALSGM
jgi:hypothetical protein